MKILTFLLVVMSISAFGFDNWDAYALLKQQKYNELQKVIDSGKWHPNMHTDNGTDTRVIYRVAGMYEWGEVDKYMETLKFLKKNGADFVGRKVAIFPDIYSIVDLATHQDSVEMLEFILENSNIPPLSLHAPFDNRDGFRSALESCSVNVMKHYQAKYNANPDCQEVTLYLDYKTCGWMDLQGEVDEFLASVSKPYKYCKEVKLECLSGGRRCDEYRTYEL